MSVCDRCFKPLDEGDHGWMVCPFEPRKANGVIPDDIPGGVWIKHGICNEDGSPKKFYSHSEIKKECEKRGFIQRVEHKPNPKSGSDKSPHTTRWI